MNKDESDLTNQPNPGHNSFVVDECGNQLLIYHARPSAHDRGECGTFNRESLYDPCRHTRVKYVHFAADGTPVLNMAQTDIVSDHCQKVTAVITEAKP